MYFCSRCGKSFSGVVTSGGGSNLCLDCFRNMRKSIQSNQVSIPVDNPVWDCENSLLSAPSWNTGYGVKIGVHTDDHEPPHFVVLEGKKTEVAEIYIPKDTSFSELVFKSKSRGYTSSMEKALIKYLKKGVNLKELKKVWSQFREDDYFPNDEELLDVDYDYLSMSRSRFWSFYVERCKEGRQGYKEFLIKYKNDPDYVDFFDKYGEGIEIYLESNYLF